jgi:hypothetical protein
VLSDVAVRNIAVSTHSLFAWQPNILCHLIQYAGTGEADLLGAEAMSGTHNTTYVVSDLRVYKQYTCMSAHRFF